MRHILHPMVCLSLVVLAPCFAFSAQDDYSDSIKAFLHDNFDQGNVGMVIGIVDSGGSRIFSAGSADNEGGAPVGADTVFEIGSITKTFTVLLLMDMVERKEMALDDPVAKYLPDSVKVPSYKGREITLLDLATQTSGLPFDPDNLSGKANLFADYTAEKLYDCLSRCVLKQEPGEKFVYSNLGMSLLGHAVALKAGQDFESLVVERICRPLDMQSTCITLTPELKARLAVGHNKSGQRAPNWDFQVIAPAGALRSTANDLLKYVSANLGLTKSELLPLMERMQVVRHQDSPEFGNSAMPWVDQGVYNPPGTELTGHAGGTAGYSTFIGFDKKNRWGVVVLANQNGRFSSSSVGWRILQHADLKGKDITAMLPVRWRVGIGTALEMDEKAHAPRIKMIVPNSPASQAGLAAGLLVQKIDDVSTVDKTLADCVAMIVGPAGTKVRLETLNPETQETNTIELTRQRFLSE